MLKNYHNISMTFVSIVGFIIAAALPGEATIISLDQSVHQTTAGNKVTVDVIASELYGQGVGSFNVTIEYDYSSLLFTGYCLSDKLGTPDTPVWDMSYGVMPGGQVNLSGFSWLTAKELLTIQDDNVNLGTLFFMGEYNEGDGIKLSTEPIVFNDPFDDGEIILTNYIGNVYGDPPRPVTAPVPEPPLTVLLLIGLSLLAGPLLRRC